VPADAEKEIARTLQTKHTVAARFTASPPAMALRVSRASGYFNTVAITAKAYENYLLRASDSVG